MPFFKNQRQYQQLAFVAVITAVTAVENTTLSSQVFFKGQFQYQSHTEPAFVPAAPVTVDEWFQYLSEPVRFKIDRQRAVTLAAPAAIGPVLDPDTQISQDFESRWHYPWSEPVRFRRFPASEQQSVIALQAPESITIDKWIYPWTEPVRQKIGLKAHLQQAFIAPVLDNETQIIQDFESRWHFPWSEPVRFRLYPTSEQPFFTIDPKTPEFVTSDKWTYPWSEPVRFRQFPTSEQQSYAAPTYTPEFITTDKWTYPWSEPVRQKIGLKTNLQQAAIGPVLESETQIIQDFESRWHFPWSEPVRIKRQVPVGEQQFLIQGPVQAPEFITVDKWIYSWSEPVRQKIWFKTHLQQALVAPVLNPETQISQDFESRWHQPWYDPVRTKRPLLIAQQQFIAQGSVQTPEFITVDKWIYPWSNPVRQKIWIRTNFQQAFIAPVLSDEQITSTIESRWHQPWSEPVRFKRFPTAEQQSYAAPATSVFESIYYDKWGFAWSEPVRQKLGLKTNLQQAFIGVILNPETQIIYGYESRWHQPWSEPVRLRNLQPARQPAIQPALVSFAEVVTLDKWFKPLNEPIRPKRISTALQQDGLAWSTQIISPLNPVLDGFTSTSSSKVIFRQWFIYESEFKSFYLETVTVDKWIYPWNEPVRLKLGLNSALQQSFIATTLEPETQIIQTYESRWHQSWSEPVRFRVFLTAEQQALSLTIHIIEPVQFDKWNYPWSEPVRQKPGLGAYLQKTTAPETPPFEILPTTVPWFDPLNEPVRLKIGLGTYLQSSFTAGTEPIENPFQVTLLATEINSDTALFGVTVYSGTTVVVKVPSVFVSIKEIPATRAADASIEEIKEIDSAAVSIEET